MNGSLLPIILLLSTTLLAAPSIAQNQLCDSTDWVDDTGFGCDAYGDAENSGWCEEYGNYEWEGSSANEACCACGGGIRNCLLSPPLEVAPGLTVENWVDYETKKFRMRLTYEGKSWIGISFENDGRPGKPIFAVIGRQEDENKSSVLKYNLYSANQDWTAGAVEMVIGSQTLKDNEFVQTESKTTMTFTKDLIEILDNPEQVVTDRSTWVYAVGLPNNQWEGTQSTQGKFNLALNPCSNNPWVITNPSINGGLVDENARFVFLRESDYKILWLAHGISFVVAWGLIAPLALASSFLRKKRASWGKINQFANTTLLLLMCASILAGVIASYLEEVSYLSIDDSYWVLGIFCGLLVYCLMVLYFGAVRAQKEKVAQEELQRKRAKHVRTRVVQPEKNEEPDVIMGLGDSLEVIPGDSPHNPKNIDQKKSLYSDPVQAPSIADPDPVLEREAETTSCSEWFSRLLLLACTAVAYYTCKSAFDDDLQVLHYELDWKYYYWGVGAVGILILLLLVPLSCCLKEQVAASAPKPSASREAPSAPKPSTSREAPSGSDQEHPSTPDNKVMFTKGVDEDSLDTPSSREHEETTLQTGDLIDMEHNLEEEEAQRSPLRASWDMDTWCL